MNLICIRKYDRRRENLNKIKVRNKNNNIMRAKSYQTRGLLSTGNSKYPSGIDKGSSSAMDNNSKGPEMTFSHKNAFEKLANCNQKIKDVLRETLQESFRKGGFLRIYPSKTSNIYDKFFAHSPTTPVFAAQTGTQT